ncbi:MAG TPA: DUF4229 domain-containing protein [Actinomycetes bacterium]|nr:DUF4229 domain-containing protein [Actinomycetes bacterium]
MAAPPALRYSLLRVTLFVAALALWFGLGLRGFWLLIAAVLMSGVVSYFLLTEPRAAMSERLSARFSRLGRRIDERTRAEDDDEHPDDGQRNV